jgi:hypothetical protein
VFILTDATYNRVAALENAPPGANTCERKLRRSYYSDDPKSDVRIANDLRFTKFTAIQVRGNHARVQATGMSSDPTERAVEEEFPTIITFVKQQDVWRITDPGVPD